MRRDHSGRKWSTTARAPSHGSSSSSSSDWSQESSSRGASKPIKVEPEDEIDLCVPWVEPGWLPPNYSYDPFEFDNGYDAYFAADEEIEFERQSDYSGWDFNDGTGNTQAIASEEVTSTTSENSKLNPDAHQMSITTNCLSFRCSIHFRHSDALE